jgi:hypothetical protein
LSLLLFSADGVGAEPSEAEGRTLGLAKHEDGNGRSWLLRAGLGC